MAGAVDSMLSRQLPAPKTFAPSREDVLSTLAFFFGDPVRRNLSRALLTRSPAQLLSGASAAVHRPSPRSSATTRSTTR